MKIKSFFSVLLLFFLVGCNDSNPMNAFKGIVGTKWLCVEVDEFSSVVFTEALFFVDRKVFHYQYLRDEVEKQSFFGTYEYNKRTKTGLLYLVTSDPSFIDGRVLYEVFRIEGDKLITNDAYTGGDTEIYVLSK